jgi:hypothetical protein
MKIIDIALKDLKHIFLSVFSLVMMFGAPLLITGLLYFAFGGLSGGKGGFAMPVIKVQVANLDQPDIETSGFAAGQMLISFLQDKSLSDVLEVSIASDETSARAAVDTQRAGIAIIIISSELPEIIGVSDRIIVLYEGRKTGECVVDETTTQKLIMKSAAGMN